MIKIEVGKLYNYKRPNWDGSIQCKAVDKNGELALLFHNDTFPTLVKNLPADAIIKEINNE